MTVVNSSDNIELTDDFLSVNSIKKGGEELRIDRKKLVIAMMDADMNTKQVAEKAKVTRATVSAVKNGRSCSDQTAIRIAEALQVKLETILE